MLDGLGATVLARIQFAFTMTFHIVFPSFTIGLASYLAVLEALWLWTGRTVFIDLFKYWLKIFSIAFGMGVVSGVVMAYQFRNQLVEVFSDKTGPILGPLMAYEVLTAFFLEAGFLGVMLFGMDRVGRTSLLRDADGRGRHADFRLLDSLRQLLDADAGRLRDQRGRAVPARKLVGDRVQSVLPIPAGAIWCWPPISPQRSSSARPVRTTCCAIRRTKARA